jgi:hypothetical protein
MECVNDSYRIEKVKVFLKSMDMSEDFPFELERLFFIRHGLSIKIEVIKEYCS